MNVNVKTVMCILRKNLRFVFFTNMYINERYAIKCFIYTYKPLCEKRDKKTNKKTSMCIIRKHECKC